MKKPQSNRTSEILLYKANGKTQVEVRFVNESIWLSQAQMGELFGKDSDTIGLHLKNVYSSGELKEKATTENSSVVRKEGRRLVKRNVKFYNLDAIISVGYRVNSKKGTQFRIWATGVLKRYLTAGYVLNERLLQKQNQKLKDLEKTIQLTARLVQQEKFSNDQTHGILVILEKYSHALTVLDDYDHQRLQISGTKFSNHKKITHKEAMGQIKIWREKEKLGALFGNEKDESFQSSLSNIYQTFDKKPLYPSLEEKAATLLYSIVKNHSFSDGNKRIAAAIFVWFLDLNEYLFLENGEKRIADNALVALTLLIAESKPSEKDTIVKVVINLINGKNL